MASTVLGTHGSGTHAARPAANTVPDGSLYSCSTHSLIYVSSYGGNSWSTWASLTGTGLSDPMTTRGDIIYRDASNVTNRLALGSAGKLLISDGTDLSWGALTRVDATLSGDVTMTSANTAYDGPSASFAAGIWFITYKALFALGTTTQTHDVTVKLWDGTTVYDESANGFPASNTSGTIGYEVAGCAIVTLGASATLKLTAFDIRASSVMKRDVTSNSATSHDATRLCGVRVGA